MVRATVTSMILILISQPTLAQCQAQWLSGPGFPGVGSNGQAGSAVYANCRWDADGPGPQPPLVIAAGSFSMIGAISTANIAAWNGVSWTALGSGLPTATQSTASVRALAVLPNGDLVAAGYFTFGAPGGMIRNIARWDGVSWSPLGWGVDSQVQALTVLSNGDLIAGGQFNNAGGSFAPASRIARWNGTVWSPIGTGLNGQAKALAALPNGGFVAGGSFSTAGGVSVNNVARYDGNSNTWSSLAAGVAGSGSSTSVDALSVLANGTLVAGGSFTTAGTAFANNIASWNGASWASLGLGVVSGSVRSIFSDTNGDLIIGGSFGGAGGNLNIKILARWNGSLWSPVGSGWFAGDVYAGAIGPNNEIIAGGTFGSYIPIPSNSNLRIAAGLVAQWNGVAWAPYGTDFIDGQISTLRVAPNGDLIAGGTFKNIRGAAAERIARWNGSAWKSLGSGVYAPYEYGSVHDVGVMANGDLIAGGYFTHAGGVLVNHIARWNGSTWSPVGQGFGPNTTVESIAVLPNGDLIAAGTFRYSADLSVVFNGIARWNGALWAPLGAGLTGSSLNAGVYKVLVMANGDIVASGNFTTAQGAPADGLARWNGSAWLPMGQSAGLLLVASNGDLIATTGGLFGIVRWDGTNWLPMAQVAGQVTAAIQLPSGDIIIGGQMTSIGGVQVKQIARYDNLVTWSPLGGGTSGGTGGITALAALPNGDVVAGGAFNNAGTYVSARLATWGAPRPTVSQFAGSGSAVRITTNALIPGNEYYGIFSLDLSPAGAGSGPIAGLSFVDPTMLSVQVSTPLGTPPFHFLAAAASESFGPYAVPFGFAFEVVNVDVTGGVLGCITPAQRYTVQ